MAAKLSREAIAKRRYRQGLRTFRVAADRADLVELLTEAGVVVGINADTSDISDALTRLVEQWNAGRLALLVQNPDGPDDDGAA